MKTSEANRAGLIGSSASGSLHSNWMREVTTAILSREPGPDETDADAMTRLRLLILQMVRVLLSAWGRRCQQHSEDLTQDILVKLLLLRSRNNFDPSRGSLWAWLLGVIRWTVRSDLRRKTMLTLRDLPESNFADLAEIAPEDRAETQELIAILTQWINELPEKSCYATAQKYTTAGQAAASGRPDTRRDHTNRSRGLTRLKERAAAELG